MDTLPNSLTREKKIDNSLSKNDQEWLFLYCASCGTDGGRVLKTDVPNREEFAFYLCEPCAQKYGSLPLHTMVPDNIFWTQVREAQLERYKRELTPREIILALDDPESDMSKLARSRNTFLASE